MSSSNPNDDAGRIHKSPFVASALVLFALCLLSACARFYIRVFVQKQVSIDDGFLLFGICTLICGIAILFTFVDNMYMVEALIFDPQSAQLIPDFLDAAYDYQKMAAVTLILCWCSIVSVKFSFLFLFRKLVDRIPALIKYWWCVTIFNVVAGAYGIAVYLVACPHFYNVQALQCTQGSGVMTTINYSVSQMVLDMVGDLLILYIPCRLIWKIRIRLSQKLALAGSLCLTVILVIVTIVRVSGLRLDGKIDSVWETYWIIIGAEVGLILAACTAFRMLFVHNNEKLQQSPRGGWQWYTKSKRLLRRTFTPRTWRTKSTGGSSDRSSGEQNHANMADLPQIPHGTMTGVRTFINGRGKTVARASQMMQSQTMEEEEDSMPLAGVGGKHGRSISVQHDITSMSERVSNDAATYTTKEGQFGQEYV
ncbi:hypothetical protein MMC17_007955 [Xylographa soralifera]|nr:hypothetical protein [Xylographa soralifera]